MATQSKTAKGSTRGKSQVKLSDMKPQKDAKGGGKKLTNKLSKNLLGASTSGFGPGNAMQQKGNIRRNED